ncbi:TRAP transporter small permease [Paracoccus alkenifer]|uniref:TRAP transporter small permease protein n=1 Tax=Paracoccus alkenifer TaxID=65735 RepID=A0A1H6LWP3_9RHOB|nr:TRAP transporter small permease [Paracoccus alkenifer]SEH89956.1 TRAP-type mannitol/chloroaromatic compound transport system, small permease component [Paracoccus alkenifer]
MAAFEGMETAQSDFETDVQDAEAGGAPAARGLIAGFQRLARLLSAFGGIVAMLILVFVTSHILLEIALRSLFGTSTYVLDEFVGYSVAAMTFLALGRAMSDGALIRVSFLLDMVRSPVLNRALRLGCILLTACLAGFMTWIFWKTVSRNFMRGVTSDTIAHVPLWIPESLVLAGLAIFFVQLLADALKLIAKNPHSAR